MVEESFDCGEKQEHFIDPGTGTDVVLKTRYVVPGLTLKDLMYIFEEASEKAPVSAIAGNPNYWPVVKGIKALVKAINEAYANALPSSSNDEFLKVLYMDLQELDRKEMYDDITLLFHEYVKNITLTNEITLVALLGYTFGFKDKIEDWNKFRDLVKIELTRRSEIQIQKMMKGL
jgi:hypothetical protein